MFNIEGSEMVMLLLVALIVLGPEKLPDAIRKFGRAYSEFKKMANGFQGELREALDDPLRELKDTADMMRAAVNFGDDAPAGAPETADAADPAPPIQREQGLNFGSANPRRNLNPDAFAANAAKPAEPVREPGLNFGSANPRPLPKRDPLAVTDPAPAATERPAGLNFGSANPQRPAPARDPLAADASTAEATDGAADQPTDSTAGHEADAEDTLG